VLAKPSNQPNGAAQLLAARLMRRLRLKRLRCRKARGYLGLLVGFFGHAMTATKTTRLTQKIPNYFCYGA
jgi:hypothetical protein